MGDGVLIYFGYPQAHEDDAERAVRAGLGVVDAVGRIDVKSAKLQARIGIATGLVVVGDLIGESSGAGTISRRRDTKPRRPPASPGRPRSCRHRRRHAPAGRRSLRIPRSTQCRGEGHRRAGVGLAGATPERRRQRRRTLKKPLARADRRKETDYGVQQRKRGGKSRPEPVLNAGVTAKDKSSRPRRCRGSGRADRWRAGRQNASRRSDLAPPHNPRHRRTRRVRT
jgi:hypothetical protein